MKVNARQQAKQAKLAAQLAEIGFALPGSLTVKAYRCGKQNCRCHGEPPQLHGPYAFWTRKADNKTVTRILNDEEVTNYQPMFDNARKIRDLVSQLQDLSLELVEPAAARPKPKATKATKATSTKTSRPQIRNGGQPLGVPQRPQN
ncbi:DUF6788 family protein [Ferrimicrobium sp.]|uniref:DUF6788 family protein n=1 Tax=Ferrimicrobium sp. TaxID=2926050 RepID=UPI002633DF09|nr:DUF6788 family protein [Ferrimicrobium sp.]